MKIRTGMLGVGMMLAAATAMAQTADAAKIARGKYLMTIGACNDCHSPKIDPQQHPDPKRPFSGRPQTTQAPNPVANRSPDEGCAPPGEEYCKQNRSHAPDLTGRRH